LSLLVECAVFGEPLLAAREVGQDSFDALPKVFAVVRLFEMD